MSTTTKSGAEKSAATSTPSLRSKAMRDQCHALTTNAWWPFDRADPRVLKMMHLSTVDRKKTMIDAPEAPF